MKDAPAHHRRPGAKWRILVHDDDVSHHITHHRDFGYPTHGYDELRERYPSLVEVSKVYEFPGAEFDELVVGRWIHLEQMDKRLWWMNVGGVTIHVTADRDGRPTSVRVDGPGDYDDPVPGCTYECTWTANGLNGDTDA